jgi:hypothetical protein
MLGSQVFRAMKIKELLVMTLYIFFGGYKCVGEKRCLNRVLCDRTIYHSQITMDRTHGVED